MKTVIFDFSNVANIIRFGFMSKSFDHTTMTEQEWQGYFLDILITSITNYIKVTKADRAVLAIDGRSWRKTYYPEYKENRKAGREKDEFLDTFYAACNKTAEFFDDFTNVKVIRSQGAEGDDIIATLAQYLSSNGEKVTIISTDGDFHQLLKHKNVNIFHPIKKVYVKDYSHMDFVTKIIKGDSGDNIPSSYPRIKADLLKLITEDETHLHQEFEKNKKLISLQKYYISKILETDIEALESLSEDEFFEALKIAKEIFEKNSKHEDKEIKQRFKDIMKLAKKEGFTEAKLFSEIIDFETAYYRNHKLIALDIDNLPTHITESILEIFESDHSAKKQSDFMKFAREHKMKEFFFGQEWSFLKKLEHK